MESPTKGWEFHTFFHGNGCLWHAVWERSAKQSWVRTPEEVTVKLLGNAAKGTEAGLILGSFNAG